jgi:hypothetical protein
LAAPRQDLHNFFLFRPPGIWQMIEGDILPARAKHGEPMSHVKANRSAINVSTEIRSPRSAAIISAVSDA